MKTFILTFLFATILFSCKNFRNLEFKETDCSLSIEESKKRNVYVNEYKIVKEIVKDNVEFRSNEIWLEKCWLNYLDKDGNEKWNIEDNCFHFVINVKDKDYFFDKIYWKKIRFVDSTGDSFDTQTGVVRGKNIINIPDSFKVFILKVQKEFKPNLDTVVIGEILLKKMKQQ